MSSMKVRGGLKPSLVLPTHLFLNLSQWLDCDPHQIHLLQLNTKGKIKNMVIHSNSLPCSLLLVDTFFILLHLSFKHNQSQLWQGNLHQTKHRQTSQRSWKALHPWLKNTVRHTKRNNSNHPIKAKCDYESADSYAVVLNKSKVAAHQNLKARAGGVALFKKNTLCLDAHFRKTRKAKQQDKNRHFRLKADYMQI